MTYNTKILAKIGREVVFRHPDIAKGILSKMDQPLRKDLDMINPYFLRYANIIQVKPRTIQGPVYKSNMTEAKKIFISAMLQIFTNQYRFNKIISEVLGQRANDTSWMISEVSFRYHKDTEFTQKVDHIIKNITHDTH